MSVCSCLEKVGLGLYGGGVWVVWTWRESAVRQAGQCLEGRVRERVYVLEQIWHFAALENC